MLWTVILVLGCVENPLRRSNLPRLLIENLAAGTRILTACSGTYEIPLSEVVRVKVIDGCTKAVSASRFRVSGSFTERGVFFKANGIKIVTKPH